MRQNRSESRVKIALVQMAATYDYDANIARATSLVSEASERGGQIVCLPELFYSRYFPRTKGGEQAPETIPGPTSDSLSKAAKAARVVLVGGSIYEKRGRSRYNTSVVFDERGKMVGRYSKVHVPQDSHYYEQDYFSPGKRYTVVDTDRGKVGALICFDQWFPEAARVNRLMGAQMLFYPTSIGWVKGIDPVEGDWHEAWEAVQRGHAIANSLVVCAANRVGVEGDMTFWGGSFVCDQFGKILVRADDREGVYIAECDLGLGPEVEEGWGFQKLRKPATYGRIVK
ncbi:MAG: acyltransferase [Thaumarchaeota archaeon]|nr:acyltransferase [Nitrososphaerota archaeon]